MSPVPTPTPVSNHSPTHTRTHTHTHTKHAYTHTRTHTHAHAHDPLRLPFSDQGAGGVAVGWGPNVPGGGELDLDSWKKDELTLSLKKDAKDAKIKLPKLTYLCEFFSIVKDIGPGKAFSKAAAKKGAFDTGVYPFNAQKIMETCKQFDELTAEEHTAVYDAYLHIVALFQDKGEALESEYDANNVVKDKDALDGTIRDQLPWWRHRAEILFCPAMREKRAEQKEAAAAAKRQKEIDDTEKERAKVERDRERTEKRVAAKRKAEEKRAAVLQLGEEIADEMKKTGWDVNKVLKKAGTKGAEKDRIKSGPTLSALAVYLGYAGGQLERVDGDTLQGAWMKVLDPMLVLKKGGGGDGGGDGGGEGVPSAEVLYCLCQKPMNEDAAELWLGCDAGCDGWFHPQCLGLSEDEARDLDEYTCASCAKGVEEGEGNGTGDEGEEGEGEDEEEMVQEAVQEDAQQIEAEEGSGRKRTSGREGTRASKRTRGATQSKN